MDMWAASLLEQFSAAAPRWLPVIVDAALKGAAILALTGLAVVAMRRASAAARHLVWFLGTLSLLVLPVMSAALPGWHILPRWAGAEAVHAPSAGSLGTALAPGEPTHFMPPAPVPTDVPPGVDRMPLVPNAVPPHVDAVAPVVPVVASPVRLRLTWQAWALLGWMAGSVLLLGHVALGVLSLRWLEYRAVRITCGGWPILMRRLCVQLGIRRRVELLSSARRTMPMTWGLWRTRLLLPADAGAWSAEERRTVLLHELAHAKRRDCLTQLAMQVVCALYWFNPLVWVAWRRMQTERERACDDLVLSTGTKASAYARQLLQIAAEMPPVRFSTAAIAMALPRNLEARLLAILDPKRNRRTLTVTAGLLVLSALVGVTVPLAMLRGQTATTAATGAVAEVQVLPPTRQYPQFWGSHAVSADGKTWAVGAGQDVFSWDPITGKHDLKLQLENGSEPRPMAFSPDGTLLAVGNRKVYAWESGKVVTQLPAAPGTAALDVLAFSTDQKMLVAGSYSQVQVYRVSDWTLLRKIDRQGRGENVGIASVSRDAKVIATALVQPTGEASPEDEADAVVVWDTLTGKRLLTLAGFRGRTVISPDGKMLAVSSANGEEAELVEVASGKVLQVFKSIGGAMAFSPDGRMLAVALKKGEVELREAATGKLTRRLGCPFAEAWIVEFLPGGAAVLAVGEKNLACVWEIGPQVGLGANAATAPAAAMERVRRAIK